MSDSDEEKKEMKKEVKKDKKKSKPEDDDDEPLHPYFMTELPSDPMSNPHYAALSSILYDDQTPEEIATNFKNQGNEAFKRGKRLDLDAAIGFYNQALEQACEDKSLVATIYSNRSAVALKQRNYRSCIKDCQTALGLDASNIKAQYRAAKAASELENYEESLTFCMAGLELEADNKAILALVKDIEPKHKEQKERRTRVQQKDKNKKRKDKLWSDMLRGKGIRVGEDEFNLVSQYDGKPYVDSGLVLHFPTMFLYPEQGQTDYITDFPGNVTFADQLAELFAVDAPPLEWDTKGDYTADNLDLYVQAYEDGPACRKAEDDYLQWLKKVWVKLDTRVTLDDLMKRQDYIIPGIPCIFAIPKKSPFLKEFLKDEKAYLY